MKSIVSVKFDDTQVTKYLRNLKGPVQQRVRVSAINKVVRTAKTFSSRELRNSRNLKVGRIKKSHRIISARRGRVRATLEMESRPPTLKNYGARVASGRGRRKKGAKRPNSPVSVEIYRGQRKTVSGAFVVHKLDGLVMKRTHNSRLSKPRALYGPSLTTEFRSRRHTKKLKDLVAKQSPTEARRALLKELSRARR